MKLPIKTKRLYITEFKESMAESVCLNSLDDDNRRFIPDEVFESVDEARKTLSALVSFYSRESRVSDTVKTIENVDDLRGTR